MKKKLAALAVAFMLVFVSLPHALAAEHAPSAEFTYADVTENDTVYNFDVGADSYILEMENTRKLTLEELTKKGYSGADISHAIRYPLELTVKCETEFGDIGYAKCADVTSKKISVSLIHDIMPSLVGENAEIDDRLLNGFSFTLTVCYTHFDGTKRYQMDIYGDSDTSTGTLNAPEMYYIGYILPSGAANAAENVSFGYAPLLTPVKLSAPSKSGCTFTGWVNSDLEYVGTVNAGTKKIILKSTWDDKRYAIKYVLTTASGYNFMRVDNTANPTSYAPGEGASLTSPAVPKGWRFMGWTDASGEAVENIPKGTIGDVVLYAYWLSEDAYIEKTISDAHWCDVDDDGKITVSDARSVLRAAVGLEDLKTGMLKRVDFAGQGKADVSQARFVLRVAVGLDTVREILEYYEYEFN